jgi:hypothetical protein
MSPDQLRVLAVTGFVALGLNIWGGPMTARYSSAGLMRRVFLVGRYAIKLPRIWAFGSYFWRGRRANARELDIWRRHPDERLCPVLWASPFAFVVVMRRAVPVDEDRLPEGWETPFLDYEDVHAGNVCVLDGRLVLVDYGGPQGAGRLTL